MHRFTVVGSLGFIRYLEQFYWYKTGNYIADRLQSISKLPLVRHEPGSGVRRIMTAAGGNTNGASLETLRFDNLALRSLPLDAAAVDDVRQRQVTGACFALVKPTPVTNPRMVVYSTPALALIGLYDGEVKRPEFVEFFAGNKLLPGSQTAAHCYCGHQFGYFAGQLGDGAAM